MSSVDGRHGCFLLIEGTQALAVRPWDRKASLLYAVALARSPPPRFHIEQPHRSMCMRRPLALTEIDLAVPGSWCHPDRPFRSARANVMQSALVPGSIVDTSASPVDRTCFSDILAAPLALVGSTTTPPLTPTTAAHCTYKDELPPPRWPSTS